MSNAKLLLFAIVCFLVALGTVAGLVKYSERLKSSPGEFLRLFPPHPILEQDTFLLGYRSYYLAGIDSERVYLGHYRAPLHLAMANFASRDTTHAALSLVGMERYRFSSIDVKVEPPHFYLVDGTVPVVYRGLIGKWNAEPYLYDSVYFLDLLPTPNGSLFIKSLSGRTGENVLGKMSAMPPWVSFNNSVLQKQLDGVFCTDGILLFNSLSSEIVFVHHYRNEVVILDSELNLVKRTRTLDTISRARIKTASIESGRAKTLASPPYYVNMRAELSNGLLFVNSALRARNEHPDAPNGGAVIDVYVLSNMRYQFSFYIYDYWGGKKLREFAVSEDKLVALFENTLIVYGFERQLFDPITKEIARANQE